MSTEKLEVNPDTGNKTLEQSAEDLKKDGVDINKDLSVNANGEGIEVRAQVYVPTPRDRIQVETDGVPREVVRRRRFCQEIVVKRP